MHSDWPPNNVVFTTGSKAEDQRYRSDPLAFRVLSTPLHQHFFRTPIIDPFEISEDAAWLILAHRRLNALGRQAFVQG